MAGRDLERLEDLGVLRPEVEEAAEPDPAAPAEATLSSEVAMTNDGTTESSITQGRSGGLSWLEEVRRSGKTRTRRGVGRSADGMTRVEYEISEYDEPDREAPGGRGKRKLDDVGTEKDAGMR